MDLKEENALNRLGEHRQVVRRHLVRRVVHERADVGLGDRDLQAQALAHRSKVLLEELRAEAVLGVQVSLAPHAHDRDAFGQHLLEPCVDRVALGVRAVLAGDVVVVIEEQRARVRRVRPAECLRNDVRAEM